VPLEKVVAGQWDRSLFDQNFTGRIGVGIAMREPRPEITHVVPDSPAARAGLVLGLIIDTVDGKETQGLDLPTVLKMVSGRHGTKIRLGLIDPQTDEPRTVEVVREWMRF
jgi:C-terminal processing protease CtpA/Prc